MNGVITSHDWTRWASIFDDNRFEIYENTAKNYAIKEVHSVIGAPVRHMLETREVLDGFTPEQRDQYLILWIRNLKIMMGQIRKTAAKDALKQLQEEGLVLTREVIEEVQNWD